MNRTRSLFNQSVYELDKNIEKISVEQARPKKLSYTKSGTDKAIVDKFLLIILMEKLSTQNLKL